MTPTERHECVLVAYAKYFETLTPDSINDLDLLAVNELSFEDPFNRVTGRDKVKALFRKMFEDMDDPAFNITETFRRQGGRSAVLKWRFTGRVPKIGEIDFTGLSEICFDEAGFITSHIDYWDAASNFYEKIPLIGTLLRLIKGRLRLS